MLGKARYIAPEIVLGKNMPNSYSDRFSMTVILFMLFCIDHPFEGMNVVRYPCMTEEIERDCSVSSFASCMMMRTQGIDPCVVFTRMR